MRSIIEWIEFLFGRSGESTRQVLIILSLSLEIVYVVNVIVAAHRKIVRIHCEPYRIAFQILWRLSISTEYKHSQLERREEEVEEEKKNL